MDPSSFSSPVLKTPEQIILINSWREKNTMESILKDFKLDSVILKFALEKNEAENVSELSDEVLSRLGELRSAIVIVSVPFVLTQQNNISLWLQLLLANEWLFQQTKWY